MMKEYFFEPKGIYYRTNAFQSEKQTLVFVHGLSGSSSAWLPYEKELEDSYNILSFDLRGHGKSKKPIAYEEYKMEDFAEDLSDLVEHLKLNKFTLISHSLGSFISLAFIDKHQDKISRAIFLSPNYSVKNMISAKIISPLLTGGIAVLKKFSFVDKSGTHIDYARFRNTGDWNIPRMIADVGNTSLHVYLYATRQTYDFEGKQIVEKINVPTLLIHGKRDTIFPVKYGIMMASKIKGSKLVIIDDADHIVALNNVDEILKEMKSFML